MAHVDTLDVDIGLDDEAVGDGEYAMRHPALRFSHLVAITGSTPAGGTNQVEIAMSPSSAAKAGVGTPRKNVLIDGSHRPAGSGRTS
ncbi:MULTISPECIES: hypothetical protein [unclassified Variovorax]|uniref:hypothetical protein n=1 Tax=unclassified Variovorax TaxID=663243 RepID=UPI001160D1C9|nr:MULTISPECIES: hypothetical protein [unclassified Variovorax]